MALKSLNDESETLDLRTGLGKLGPIAILLRGQLAYQPMQRIDVIRQSIEIEGHVSECKTAAQKRHANPPHESIGRASRSSSGNGRAPQPLRRAPVDAVDQLRQLR